MNIKTTPFKLKAKAYLKCLESSFNNDDILSKIEELAKDLRRAWEEGRQVFICGNGGSAANALHMANDFHYGIGACGPGPKLPGLRVEALTANTGIITCLANDTGYQNIYSHQLNVKGKEKDILIALSGSGNSKNIVNAIRKSHELNMKSFAILGFKGGTCLEMADVSIHFPIDDMQIAEDSQLVIGHICMQWLNSNKPKEII